MKLIIEIDDNTTINDFSKFGVELNIALSKLKYRDIIREIRVEEWMGEKFWTQEYKDIPDFSRSINK